jgi:8-oxo-dGTP diphosphatase
MIAKNNRPKVGAAVFVWRNGTFYMCKRTGAHGEGTWSVPGGHVEYGEELAEAAARETFEETGMKIKNVEQIAVTNDVFHEHQKHYVTIWFRADWDQNEPSIMEPDKILETRWATFQDLPSPLFEPCWQNLRKAKPELFTTDAVRLRQTTRRFHGKH